MAPGSHLRATFLPLAALVVFAQPPERPKFEVAAVKASQENRFMSVRPLPGGRLTADAPLRLLIQNAYSVQAFQIVGGPAWIQSDHYAIEAKGDGGATRAQVLLMLQNLLEERFQLKTHRDTRELPVYALVAAKNGAKLPPPKEDGCVVVEPGAPPPPAPGRGQPMPAPCGRLMIMAQPSGVRVQGGRIAMPELTRILATIMGRPVVDKTGISQQFDVRLEFILDATAAGILSTGPPGAFADAPASDNAGPSIFSAIQEQLGLKLESSKGPVEVMVIDRVERPSAN